MANIALALLIIDGKILMCKREKKDSDKFSEMYGLPGGHIKKDESNKDGAVRETKEETNLTIHNPKFIKTYQFDDNQIHLYTKEIKNIDGIKLNHEHTDYKLVSPKDLKDPEIIPTTKDMYKDCKDKPLNEEIQRMKSIMGLNEQENHIGSWNMQSPIQMNPDEIFNFIRSLPIKFHLTTKYGESFKLYPDGINTAINNSAITRFYLKYLRKIKKTSGVINIPILDPNPYHTINELIKIIDNLHIPEEETNEPESLLGMSDKNKYSMQNRLLRANCFQLMNALLYEDFFNVDFKHGSAHNIVNDTQLPTNQEDLNKLYEQWNDKEGEVRHLFFYADVIPIVRTIEKY